MHKIDTQYKLCETIDGNPSLDITSPKEGVEIDVRLDGKVIWINVDGVCILRICQIPQLIVRDARVG